MISSLINYLTEKEKRKALELERKISIETREHELKIKKIDLEEKFLNDGKILPESLDRLSMEHMQNSWKDEFIMFILFIPIIFSFIPGLQEAGAKGFTIMKSVPDWYMYLLVAIVVVTYGLRGLIRFLVTNKSTKEPKVNIFNTKPKELPAVVDSADDKLEPEIDLDVMEEIIEVEKDEHRIKEFERK